jgi:hypothetical protein
MQNVATRDDIAHVPYRHSLAGRGGNALRTQTTKTTGVLLLSAALFAAGASAQVALRREEGIRGKVVIAPEVQKRTTRVVDAARAGFLRTPARLRWPSGRSIAQVTEPRGELLVVLTGRDAPREARPAPTVVARGLQFFPAQVLLPRAGELLLKNEQKAPLVVVFEDASHKANDETRVSIAAGETGRLSAPEGNWELVVEGAPYQHASVSVLHDGRVLKMDENGNVPFVEVPGGDYTLSMYVGNTLLAQDALAIPERGLMYFEATVTDAEAVSWVKTPMAARELVAVPTPNPTAPSVPTPPPPSPIDN